jgi:hypothetical protein
MSTPIALPRGRLDDPSIDEKADAAARAIQEVAGHADLTTTQRYMHLSPSATEDAIRWLDDRQMGIARGVGLEAEAAGGSNFRSCNRLVERATGIEPVSEAWEASVLPLY